MNCLFIHLYLYILYPISFIYSDINNGVYRAGFAFTQTAYDKAVREVFTGLDRVEEILSRQRYLTGSQITEADVRLFTTLVRFDLVYVGHFKVQFNDYYCIIVKYCLVLVQ